MRHRIPSKIYKEANHTLYFTDKNKDKNVTGPLVKIVDKLSIKDPLTPDNIAKMKSNIFVNLRDKFPHLSRRELRAEAQRRLNVEIKRRKEQEKNSGSTTDKA